MSKINPEAEKYINWIKDRMNNKKIYDDYVDQFMDRAIEFFSDREMVIFLTEKKLRKAAIEYGSPLYSEGENSETDLEEVFEEFIDGCFGWPSRTDYNEQKRKASN